MKKYFISATTKYCELYNHVNAPYLRKTFNLKNFSISIILLHHIPQYKEVIEDCWSEIRERQSNGYAGIPFKFPTLNEYATIEPGELFIFAAEAKQGKSMMLLNPNLIILILQ